jgi:hypothetical protein
MEWSLNTLNVVGGGQWTWVQGHREWLNEVYFLGRFRHPNLVRLIGFCAQLTSLQEERLLVYEFVLHGSLENLLFQSTNFFMPMPWNRRWVGVVGDGGSNTAIIVLSAYLLLAYEGTGTSSSDSLVFTICGYGNHLPLLWQERLAFPYSIWERVYFYGM